MIFMANINQNGSNNSKMVFTQAKDCTKTTHKNLNDDDVHSFIYFTFHRSTVQQVGYRTRQSDT
jgi:hypothetical protein